MPRGGGAAQLDRTRPCLVENGRSLLSLCTPTGASAGPQRRPAFQLHRMKQAAGVQKVRAGAADVNYSTWQAFPLKFNMPKFSSLPKLLRALARAPLSRMVRVRWTSHDVGPGRDLCETAPEDGWGVLCLSRVVQKV